VPQATKPGETELTDALHTLLQVCFAGGREELWEPFERAIARLAPDIPAALYLGSMTLADPLRTPAAVLEQLSKEIDGLGQELDPTRIVRLAIACNFVDRVPGCRQALWRVVRAGREEGAIASGIFALILLGVDDYWSGQWDEAHRLLDEADELCDVHGYRLLFMTRARNAGAPRGGMRVTTTRHVRCATRCCSGPRRGGSEPCSVLPGRFKRSPR